jgi:hypothetical protein
MRLSSILRFRRSPRREGLLGQVVPGELKTVTVNELVSLGELAASQHFSATGRPQWIEDNRDGIVSVVLMPVGNKHFPPGSLSCLRCFACVTLKGRGAHVFPLDVSPSDFQRLHDVSEAWRLGELIIYHLPHVPLDAEQQQAWDDFKRY